MPRSERAAVLLVTSPDGRFRWALHNRHPSDPYRLFDDALAAAREAARRQLNGALASDEGNTWSFRGLWRVRDHVHRSDIVHLQDASSVGAAVCTLWAWMYYRPTIVGPGADATGCSPAVRGWRRRVFALCFGGPIVRFATLVVFPDQENPNRMLARNVEPSGSNSTARRSISLRSTRACTRRSPFPACPNHSISSGHPTTP